MPRMYLTVKLKERVCAPTMLLVERVAHAHATSTAAGCVYSGAVISPVYDFPAWFAGLLCAPDVDY